MTPKDKANEIINKMYLVHSNTYSEITKHFAKQCALIAVDLILHDENINHEFKSDYDYWVEVKKEIELL